MVAPPSAGARFRQRKISVKLSLNIYRQHELPDLEAEQQRNVHEIESGVDKAEETEEHLQKVILAAEAAVNGQKVDQVYIPTPDASQHWPEASKYYKGKFVEPSSYIKFSATVEDTCGTQYNMDEEDEEFWKELNKEFPKKQLSETEFEIVCERFENVINEKQPFLSIDPESIFEYDELKEYALSTGGTSPEDVSRKLEEELNIHPFVTLFDCKEAKPPRKLSVLLDLYGEKIYAHWRTRRVRRLGRPVFPILKFEDPSEKNDNDPYVCFRRREFRQARKTRRTDTQGSERLRRLHIELRSIRELVLMCAQREVKRLDALKVERNIFKLRCDVKSVKRELNIKGEDEDLITHKKKKPVPPETKKEEVKEKVKVGRPKLQELNPNQEVPVKGEEQRKPPVNPVAVQPYVKLPASKIPDIDLVTVQAVLNEKDSAIARAVYEKLKTRKDLDHGWINLTDDSNNPLFDLEQPQVKVVEKSHIPFSSISTALYEVKSAHYIDAQTSDAIRHKRVLPGTKSFRASNGEVVDPSTPEYYQLIANPQSSLSRPLMQLRKRVGRGNLTYIDRKFMRTPDEIDEFLNFSEDDESAEEKVHGVVLKGNKTVLEPPLKKSCIRNVYDSTSDSLLRLKSRWIFDNESNSDVAVDPSRLNNISSQTQSIRFGSMILTKSLQNLQQQHRNHIQQQQQLLLQLQLQQQQQQQQLKKNGSVANGHANGTNKVKHSNSQKPAGSGNSASPNGSTPAKRRKSTVSLKNNVALNTTTNNNNKGSTSGSPVITSTATATATAAPVVLSNSSNTTPTNGSSIRTGISTG